jgi:hypothetical protein
MLVGGICYLDQGKGSKVGEEEEEKEEEKRYSKIPPFYF